MLRWAKMTEEQRENQRAASRRWREKNREQSRESTRQWQARNPDWHLRQTYGLTSGDIVQMRARQNGCCPICMQDLPAGRNTHVDHCHVTGKVRGLLCSRCNKALGLLREDVPTMQRMIAYAEEHRPC